VERSAARSESGMPRSRARADGFGHKSSVQGAKGCQNCALLTLVCALGNVSAPELVHHCLTSTSQIRICVSIFERAQILQCQRLIEYHTATHRGGTEYDLVLRLRPDVLLPPEPLELSKAASIVQHVRTSVRSCTLSLTFWPLCRN